jgi:transcriptional regulator with XRE-family HTH domain
MFTTELERILEEQGRRRDWLAARIGCSPALVTMVAKGQRRPSPEFRAKAAEALGIDPTELFPQAANSPA